MIWLPEGRRGEGWGRILMEKAEAIGRRRRCRGATLFTNSFLAPEFYRHLGYKRIGTLDHSPKGHKRYWLMKKF